MHLGRECCVGFLLPGFPSQSLPKIAAPKIDFTECDVKNHMNFARKVAISVTVLKIKLVDLLSFFEFYGKIS